MHACDPVPIVAGLRLAALRVAVAPLKYDKTLLKMNAILRHKYFTSFCLLFKPGPLLKN